MSYDKRQRAKQKDRAHSPARISRGIAYEFCDKCGLVFLRNETTRPLIRKGCRWTEEDCDA